MRFTRDLCVMHDLYITCFLRVGGLRSVYVLSEHRRRGSLGCWRGTGRGVRFRNSFLQLCPWEETSHSEEMRTLCTKAHFRQLWQRQIASCFHCHLQMAPSRERASPPTSRTSEIGHFLDRPSAGPCLLTSLRVSVFWLTTTDV